jgi:hypothetical protein
VILGAHWGDLWRVGNLILAAIDTGWALHLLHLTYLVRPGRRDRRAVPGLRLGIIALAVDTAALGAIANSHLGGEPVKWTTWVSTVALVVAFVAVSNVKPRDLFIRRARRPDDTGDAR